MSRAKKNNNKGLPLLISIAAFDSREPVVRHIADNVPIEDVKPITFEDYQPWGATPLNDSVLKFGERLDERFRANPEALHVGLLADESGSMSPLHSNVIEGFNTFLGELKDDENPTTEPGVIMVIMTDGLENASTETDGAAVQAWIKQREEDGWNFFYLGANQDAWGTGLGLGLGAQSSSFTYTADSGGTQQAFSGMSSGVNLRKVTPSNLHSQAFASVTPGVQNYAGDDDKLNVKPVNPASDESIKLAKTLASQVKTGSE